eukprot:CAMPEP_0113488768 /NCGR_PEP_ID=MMETSP0014_2-20120614/26188_1 /TAXON_ID=2857 /ORGANISM="Nitzschia sp." /LENGTH=299 /DNA_ID=CAMNT_0000382493 /DNA_START=89 /DNA_END=988 /DNA_ORIENTATION=+ /assembly_acc=CAM_ASM_000159
MMNRAIRFLSCTALLVSPAFVVVEAQFGVAGRNKKKEGSTFQELNEMAKKQGGAGGMGGDMDAMMKQMGMDPAELQKMMGEIDPEQLKELADLGPKFDEIMDMMANMSPEQLQAQMQEAMNMMAGGEMMENLMQQKDYILKAMEESGALSEEELARMKTDPEYMEQKIKEGLGQMADMFADPEVLKLATESMKGATEMYKNPEKLNDMVGEMGSMMDQMMGSLSDEQIEEVRLLFLDKDGAGAQNPMIKQLIDSMGEFGALDDVLHDPKKWRDTIKSGMGMMDKAKPGRVAGGAGMGEL